MRFRSVLTVLAMSGALGAAVLRCAVPPEPPPSRALPTRPAILRGAILSISGDTLDRDALVASLRELRLNVVVIEGSANQDGAFVQDRVALAIELQSKLEADVFIGTYARDALRGKPMEALLLPEPTFVSCYAGGRVLAADDSALDKLRICSQDVSNAIVEELGRTSASARIGCYVPHQVELVDTLPEDGRQRLASFFRDSAGPCGAAKRVVATSAIVSNRPVAPEPAAKLFGAALQGAGVDLIVLDDGVGTFPDASPGRAQAHYEALRLALLLRSPSPQVWANVEAFACEQPDCKKTRPANEDRFKQQLCAARTRVDGILTYEYLHHLAGQPLATTAAGVDGSAAQQSIAEDVDAAALLRTEYLDWRDAGAPCEP